MIINKMMFGREVIGVYEDLRTGIEGWSSKSS